MVRSSSVRIKLRLPVEVAQDVILRHLHCASEWQQMPFDPERQPVEIDNLDGSIETDVHICCILPTLLDSILELVGSEGWRDRYDHQTAVSVGSAVCAFALESGVQLSVAKPTLRPVRRYRPRAHMLRLN